MPSSDPPSPDPSPPAPRPGDEGRFRRWIRRDSEDAPTFLDLTDRDEITAVLLAPPSAYRGLRRRVVDQFTLISANRCRLQRSINWGPLDGLLTDAAVEANLLPSGGRARLPEEVALLLPVSTLPKRALVAFDLSGPSGTDAHLMPYPVSVAVQGNLVTRMAADLGHEPSERVRCMIDAVSRFRPGQLTGNLRRHPRPGRPMPPELLRSYLRYREDEGALPPISPGLESWLATVRGAQEILDAALAEPLDPLSSADTLLLAVGELLRDRRVPEGIDADGLREYPAEFARWLSRLAREGDAARPVLATVAEYGRRWEALAAVRLDPYRPALIKLVEEQRALLRRRDPASDEHGTARAWLSRVGLSPTAMVDSDPGGPGSYHVSIGTDDASIELRSPLLLDTSGRPIEHAYIEDVQENREVYAFYTTDARRPVRASLSVGLSVSADVSRVTAAILALMVVSVVVAAVPVPLDADGVAVITIPASFAATVVLTRERSSLAAWVLAPYKTTLLLMLVVLAALAGARVLGWHPPLS